MEETRYCPGVTYLKFSRASSPLEPSVCHGILPCATATFTSDEADVGLRPKMNGQSNVTIKVEIKKATEIEASKSEGSRHDG